jgi:hypothetical protein
MVYGIVEQKRLEETEQHIEDLSGQVADGFYV